MSAFCQRLYHRKYQRRGLGGHKKPEFANVVCERPLTPISKFNNFLWVCKFLGKNLSNFVSPPWKLDNPYCHKQELWQSQSSFAPYTRKKKFVAAKQSVLCQQQRWLCQTFAPLIFILRLNLIAEFSCSSLFFFIQKNFWKATTTLYFFFYSFLSLDLE